jgi:hypothetical protein
MEAEEINTPVITIILRDGRGNLLATEKNIANNRSILGFTQTLITAYGPRTSINFMIREDDDDDNPFITTSNNFYSF